MLLKHVSISVRSKMMNTNMQYSICSHHTLKHIFLVQKKSQAKNFIHLWFKFIFVKIISTSNMRRLTLSGLFRFCFHWKIFLLFTKPAFRKKIYCKDWATTQSYYYWVNNITTMFASANFVEMLRYPHTPATLRQT